LAEVNLLVSIEWAIAARMGFKSTYAEHAKIASSSSNRTHVMNRPGLVVQSPLDQFQV
jgi:hypothetical protein